MCRDCLMYLDEGIRRQNLAPSLSARLQAAVAIVQSRCHGLSSSGVHVITYTSARRQWVEICCFTMLTIWR